MSKPRITVGVPVYKGADHIAKALDCLQRQTFRDFEVIISVDGGDAETAAACRPFLADPRFRMVVHPERLDWFGNFNWLLQQDLRSFSVTGSMTTRRRQSFSKCCCRPRIASRMPRPCTATVNGLAARNDLEVSPSIEGEPLDRMLQYVEQITANAGAEALIRTAAIRQAGLVTPR